MQTILYSVVFNLMIRIEHLYEIISIYIKSS